MTEKKELNNEELEKVSGGEIVYNMQMWLEYDTNSIRPSDLPGYINSEVIVFCSRGYVCCGTLKEIVVESVGCSDRTRAKIQQNGQRSAGKCYIANDGGLIKVGLEEEGYYIYKVTRYK